MSPEQVAARKLELDELRDEYLSHLDESVREVRAAIDEFIAAGNRRQKRRGRARLEQLESLEERHRRQLESTYSRLLSNVAPILETFATVQHEAEAGLARIFG